MASNYITLYPDFIMILSILAAIFLGLATISTSAEPLPDLQTDLARTSVSGVSSGAYMAGQMGIAFSDIVIGTGIVAGGPYDCAEGSLTLALQRCMEANLGHPDPARLAARALAREARAEIAPLAGLRRARIYVAGGTEDETVWPEVVGSVPALYEALGVPATQVRVERSIAAGHGLITETFGNPCGTTARPYLNACGLDQAGAILQHIHGPLASPSTQPEGALLTFDQSAFLPDPTAQGLARQGILYVPDACRAGGCAVHVAFHGCRQNAAAVGDTFARNAGFNRWADRNHLVILYPQTQATSLNPNACWDWWGYDDAGYATRDGRQMRAIHAMLERLAGVRALPGTMCARHTATNLEHWRARRARVCNWAFFCAIGSGEPLGGAIRTTTLFESSAGSFGTETCQS